MRVAMLLLLLAGCDKLFSLQHVALVDAAPDVAIDAPADAAPTFRGCSDMTREGFADTTTFPALAACAGAWTIAGLRPDPPVSCGRAAGNQGVNVNGTGCSATDLCAEGWHVCRTKFEVLERLPVADRTCGGLMSAPNTFFATAQSGPGGGTCDATGTDDVFGCGTYGIVAAVECAPLDRVSDNQCFTIKAVGGWECLDAGSEVTTIRKSDPTAGGGVLCCRDTP